MNDAPHAPRDVAPGSGRWRRHAARLAVVALGVGGAACGGEGSAPAPGASVTAAPSPAAAPVAPAAKVEAASFTATIDAADATAGAPATATVTVVPAAGYKVNEEYPYKCKLEAPPTGVSYPTPVVTEVERTKEKATMKLPFVAAQPGTAKVGGTCSLSVCTPDNCVIEKVALVTDVKVAAAP